MTLSIPMHQIEGKRFGLIGCALKLLQEQLGTAPDMKKLSVEEGDEKLNFIYDETITE